MRYAYDYRNTYTRGWVRGDFGTFSLTAAGIGEATTALTSIAATWTNGTDLRLVEIDADGKETFPPVTAKGSRGELPKDK